MRNENFSCYQIVDLFKNAKVYRNGYSNKYDIANDLNLKYFRG